MIITLMFDLCPLSTALSAKIVNLQINDDDTYMAPPVFGRPKCGSFLKCAFIFKMWKVLWVLFFLFLKNTNASCQESMIYYIDKKLLEERA